MPKRAFRRISEPREDMQGIALKQRYGKLLGYISYGSKVSAHILIAERRQFDFIKHYLFPLGSCYLCYGKAEHRHHVIPLSRGGRNTVRNLIGLCVPCHDWLHKASQYKKGTARKQAKKRWFNQHTPEALAANKVKQELSYLYSHGSFSSCQQTTYVNK